MILHALLLTVALSTPEDLTTKELIKYYWDCDASFMKEELHPNDIFGCIAITDELKEREFHGDHSEFLTWWRKNKQHEWRKRGYIHKPK